MKMSNLLTLLGILFSFSNPHGGYCAVPDTHFGRPIDASRDLYPPPLMTKDPSRVMLGNERLLYAVWFLQVDRVRELVDSGEFDINMRATYGSSHTLLHDLCGPLRSNFAYSLYKAEFHEIMEIIANAPGVRFDLISEYGRTAYEECMRNGSPERTAIIERAIQRTIPVEPPHPYQLAQ